MRGITARTTKFDYIVTSFVPEFAVEVCDLILRPPTMIRMKEQLTKLTAASEQ